MTLKEFSGAYFHPLTDGGEIRCAKDYFDQFIEEYDKHQKKTGADFQKGESVWALRNGVVIQAQVEELSPVLQFELVGKKFVFNAHPWEVFKTREAAKEYIITQALAQAGLAE